DSTPAQQSDRDKKLQDIEAKVKALLKEVQALQGSKPSKEVQGITIDFSNDRKVDVLRDVIVDFALVNDVSRKPAEVMLSRTTYNLPAAKAEALGRLLQQHFKAAVMETKVEGDSLTITTTPEVQQGIRQFIALMEGKGQAPQQIQLEKK